MKMQEVRKIAKEWGVKTARVSKGEVIRGIQRAEGNFPCFGSAVAGICDQQDCLWRSECLDVSVKGIS